MSPSAQHWQQAMQLSKTATDAALNNIHAQIQSHTMIHFYAMVHLDALVFNTLHVQT